MKILLLLLSIYSALASVNAAEFDAEIFANNYFNAWTATQTPKATKNDIEHYLSFLADDIGHQHLPYDVNDERDPEGKNNMREGMNYYLGAHLEYTGTLINKILGNNVVIIQYDTSSKGIHPQTKELITQNYRTLEILEIENGKVSVIRKYSE